MAKICVIGGGASGLVAAIFAKRNGHDVTILEGNNECGKKLQITGNGRGNYFNSNMALNYYNSQNIDLLENIVNPENIAKINNFFKEIGLVANIKDGYYYPNSNQAISIKSVLLNEIKYLNIKIVYNHLVTNIKKDNNLFCITTNQGDFIADKVIIATGSKSYPKTGSTGIGYDLAKNFNHTIIPVLPALVQLKGQDSFYKEWSGIRTTVNLKLYENNQYIKQENGEIQLTDYGISGICVYNLSSLVARGLYKNKREVIHINFLPFLNFDNAMELLDWFEKRATVIKNRTISELFDSLLNYKLVNVFLKVLKIAKNKHWFDLTKNEKLSLCKMLIDYEFIVTETNSFDHAQVCSGGIPLSEINTKTMESLKVKNLYFTGEILDVDGQCGGYNLGFAWLSGMLAGENIND